MALWRLYYHLVWSTHERLPLITANMEPILYGYMIGKAVHNGAIVHAIGGIETHVHVVASIPPKIAISKFVKDAKGASSHHINHGPRKFPGTFAWQRGYGVFSFGEKAMPDTVAYVRNQKEHHRRVSSLIALLERDEDEDDGPMLWQNGEAIKEFPPLTLTTFDDDNNE